MLYILCGKNVSFISSDMHGQQNCPLQVFTWVLDCPGLGLANFNKDTEGSGKYQAGANFNYFEEVALMGVRYYIHVCNFTT